MRAAGALRDPGLSMREGRAGIGCAQLENRREKDAQAGGA